MATDKQKLGTFGEEQIRLAIDCPSCKRNKTLKRLPPNFKCADIICDFCGYLAQVKSRTTETPHILPKTILGAAWGPQSERMEAGIFFPLFVVQTNKTRTRVNAFYLPSDLQTRDMFVPRKPLGPKARRAGWQGYYINLSGISDRFVNLF
ncbi:DpnI domain-containing protein [Roseibium sp.]|uniref:DpnI domain-containing protein n=1 Tax=Roseibium sp. TaxID=1936156 RepID=UPI003D11E08A